VIRKAKAGERDNGPLSRLGTVRVRRTADGTPVVAPLDPPQSVQTVAVHGNVMQEKINFAVSP
jgi:hypothetical protein